MPERATSPTSSPEPTFWPAPVVSGAARAARSTSATGETRPRDVLAALRVFRAADAAMRQRAQAQLAVNETDLLAIRHLIQGEARRTPVSPKDLSVYLGISSAATAKLLARLSRTGHIRREAHAVDGRVQLLYATSAAHQEVRRALGAVHDRMFAAAEGLDPAQRRAVIHFLTAVAEAMSGDASLPAPEPIAALAPDPGAAPDRGLKAGLLHGTA
ncbi:MarR family winged helix-turn-helix transcriptional regulator [Cryobacterium breve]|jgi:DNA-binding MarR family transcriptional regulator|uniref:MarR family winged helix-turn-helix transcriptional regulator n=1 Tax=Cryobacterium breve TaxID=1259258 RepID=A0ABY7NC84_9MICO|nr:MULTISPECIES: MarR family winged helix-turn-helix transcriptional regulator [Cryobacterium]MDY7543604.1 MarR family winged helix-turn-helix transcriptional regulator [Cryobacterium sp. 5B3]MEA9998708.1 MarR family winged helix-turn-helix transcriptional regulator [Cryobacterium sp. RTS3]MEB0266474.1 MarR family winged helix-turn-helix transcriptional regulator [Cryobacterium sp. 10I5]MEB0273039.1 MarR family winged helix-turn-helix transcriptional regulator [Cryobacterium sp. 5B3]WBM80132.1